LLIHLKLQDYHDVSKMHACGIALINPPWKTKETLEESILPFLGEQLDAKWELIEKVQ